MPVIEKIEEFYDDEELMILKYHTVISQNHCVIMHLENDYEDEEYISEGFGETKIEMVYKAVVDFIKWYNNRE